MWVSDGLVVGDTFIMDYEYEVTIQTDEPLGQFFEQSLEEWLSTPYEFNNDTPSHVSVDMERQQ